MIGERLIQPVLRDVRVHLHHLGIAVDVRLFEQLRLILLVPENGGLGGEGPLHALGLIPLPRKQ